MSDETKNSTSSAGSSADSASTDYGVSYKATDVPVGIAEELRTAAAAAGMSLKGAVAFLIRPPAGSRYSPELEGEEMQAAWQGWLADLQERIHAGQKVAARHLHAPTVFISLHLPPDYRDALRDAGQIMGTSAAAAGRLILIGASAGEGGILGALTPPPSKGAEGVDEEAAVVLAGAE